MQQPSIGRIVHYVSYGTPGGEYKKECRAAVITQVGGTQQSQIDGAVVDTIGLAVLNPAGMFFQPAIEQAEDAEPKGGTWHWPERV